VDRHVVDALAGLVGDDLEQQLGGQLLGLLDALDRLVDRHRPDRDRRGFDHRQARLVDALAGRQVHYGVGAPSLGQAELVDLLFERRGRRRAADVRVDLHARLQADRHRVQGAVEDVGGDDHPPARDLIKDGLRGQVLALGDPPHLGRDIAATGEVHLGPAVVVGSERAAAQHGASSPSLV